LLRLKINGPVPFLLLHGLDIKLNGLINFAGHLKKPRGITYVTLRGSHYWDVKRAAKKLLETTKQTDYIWHHHELCGIMMLVDKKVHSIIGHPGGKFFWSIAMGRKYK
jgi:hypothetical protein